ncbi:MAG: prepilin-type N-terminal cleavage/methylation domain-containing protein [Angelakisella sp.]
MNALRSKKGFTLVEIIVVLVIIAILAAISLPALTGYIDDARDKTAISEGRTVFVAAQTISSELTGLNADADNIETWLTAGTRGTTGNVVPSGYTTYIETLTGMTAPATPGHVFLTTVTINNEGAITAFTYTTGGRTVTYDKATNSMTVS